MVSYGMSNLASISTNFRVRYSETDRMGYMYYGNYAAWFEVGRVELLRSIGFAYRQMEDDGLILPVRDFNIRYFKPIRYDEAVTLHTYLLELKGARITFDFEIRNELQEIATKATVRLVFCDKSSGRPIKPPKGLLDTLGV